MSINDPGELRAKAAEAAHQARQCSSLSAIRSFRRTEKAYLALAENEDWLAGRFASATTEPVLGSAPANRHGTRSRIWPRGSDDGRMVRRARRRFR